MSHHLDSPTSRRDPRLNLTDLYVFDGTEGTVLVMATNTSLAGAARTGGFHPEGRYEFKIHQDGASVESLTYRFSFGGPAADGTQDWRLERLDGAAAADAAADGAVVARGRTGEPFEGGASGLRVWAGPAADPFYLDLGHLAHVVQGLQHEQPIDLGDWLEEKAASSFTGSRVEAVVLEVPYARDGDLPSGRAIGVWARTQLATDAGGWQQVNRTAIPMVWPLLRAIGGDDDSEQYARDGLAHPSQDRGNDTERFTHLIAAAVGSSGIGDPRAHAQQVANRLLPDVLPYDVGTPAAFSFAGFNGRRFADNAPEVMYALLTNSAVPTGLTAADAAETRQDRFPYVVPSA